MLLDLQQTIDTLIVTFNKKIKYIRFNVIVISVFGRSLKISLQ